jgi:hypothetical protein
MSFKSKFSALILSNGSSEYYPDNSLSRFSVKFPFSLELPLNAQEKWFLTLQSITISTKYDDYHQNFLHPVMIQIDNNVAKIDNHKPIIISNFQPKSHANIDISNIHKNLLQWIEHLNKIKNYRNISYYYTILNLERDIKFLHDTFAQDENLKCDMPTSRIIKIQPNPLSALIEKFFLIRTDLLKYVRVTYTDNSSDFSKPVESKKLFKDVQSAMDILMSEALIDSINYTVFVLDEKHTTLLIEFIELCPKLQNLPRIIKVKCDNIKEQVYNNTFSKDLAVFIPAIENKTDHYFYQFKTPSYIPLLSSTLSDLHFYLTDENDKQLYLSKSMATVLNTTFKTMPTYFKSFYVRLSPGYYPNNLISQFKNVLNSTLNFNAKWYVGLKSIIFPNDFKIFNEEYGEIKLTKLDYDGNPMPGNHIIKIKNKSFYEIGDFINYLNEKVHPVNIIHFELAPENASLVRIKANMPVIVELSKCIANVLGLPMDQNSSHFTFTLRKPFSKLKSTDPISMMYYRPAYLMIYCDIIEQSVISGIFAQILGTIPVENLSNPMQLQFREMESIQYHLLDKLIIPEINIEIRDPSGKKVHFNNDTLLIELHFTNYAKDNDFF